MLTYPSLLTFPDCSILKDVLNLFKAHGAHLFSVLDQRDIGRCGPDKKKRREYHTSYFHHFSERDAKGQLSKRR